MMRGSGSRLVPGVFVEVRAVPPKPGSPVKAIALEKGTGRVILFDKDEPLTGAIEPGDIVYGYVKKVFQRFVVLTPLEVRKKLECRGILFEVSSSGSVCVELKGCQKAKEFLGKEVEVSLTVVLRRDDVGT